MEKLPGKGGAGREAAGEARDDLISGMFSVGYGVGVRGLLDNINRIKEFCDPPPPPLR